MPDSTVTVTVWLTFWTSAPIREQVRKSILLVVALDSDGDGIADYMDKCQDTPKGTVVDYAGCAYFSAATTAASTWVFKDVQFKTNSDTINSNHSTRWTKSLKN